VCACSLAFYVIYRMTCDDARSRRDMFQTVVYFLPFVNLVIKYHT
jgi:TRAP-type mannitol/chloroaromatic compound transport system permease small subunit